eukprot:scaffold5787_cov157-Amphora_coffeaeformis.AAC.13
MLSLLLLLLNQAKIKKTTLEWDGSILHTNALMSDTNELFVPPQQWAPMVVGVRGVSFLGGSDLTFRNFLNDDVT